MNPENSGSDNFTPYERILWNRRPENNRDGGDIDEIVMRNVNIHIEQMNDGVWWIGIYRPDGEHYWMGNFHPANPRSRTKLCFSEQENHGIEWWQDKSHEDWKKGVS